MEHCIKLFYLKTSILTFDRILISAITELEYGLQKFEILDFFFDEALYNH